MCHVPHFESKRRIQLCDEEALSGESGHTGRIVDEDHEHIDGNSVSFLVEE